MTPLRIERTADGVAVLTLDLPERRNAMTAELTAAWATAIPQLAADRALRCVVVTGAGQAFSAGGDLDWMESTGMRDAAVVREQIQPFYRTWLAIRDLEVPTIAALNGAAIGAGMAVALACDLRYAVPSARLAVPFTALGISPGMASSWLLPEVAGLAVARDLLLTGRAVTGAEAVTLGLVNGTFPAETFLADVLAVARTVASRAPAATRLTKLALGAGRPASLEEALVQETTVQPVTIASADAREGVRAQRERRPADFTS